MIVIETMLMKFTIPEATSNDSHKLQQLDRSEASSVLYYKRLLNKPVAVVRPTNKKSFPHRPSLVCIIIPVDTIFSDLQAILLRITNNCSILHP